MRRANIVSGVVRIEAVSVGDDPFRIPKQTKQPPDGGGGCYPPGRTRWGDWRYNTPNPVALSTPTIRFQSNRRVLERIKETGDAPGVSKVHRKRTGGST